METKKSIRKEIFARRASHTDREIYDLSLLVTKQVLFLETFQKAEEIYIYADYNHEVATGKLIEEAWKAGKKVAVPRVEGKDMVFYELEDFSQLAPGYCKIPEPVKGKRAEWENPLMIMPGVAFDRNCHRVGYGGGFYDRFLEVHKIPHIAVAFEFQILDWVPVEPTDILPEQVITETRIYFAGANK